MLTINKIYKNTPEYPASLLSFPGLDPPENIKYRGNKDLLGKPKAAIFCSNFCPAGLIIKSLDMAMEMRKKDITIISGFHSPVEQEILNILLRGKSPIILSPARSIENMRIKKKYKERIEKGKMLIISPFKAKNNRITTHNCLYRNRFVVALAEKVFVIHASKGGKLESLVRELKNLKKPVDVF